MSQRKIGLLVINGPLPPPYGGVATYLSHALPYLAERGFEVHTIIDRPPSAPGQYKEFERAGIHIHYGGDTRSRKVWQILRRLPRWISALRITGASIPTFINALKSIATWIQVSERVIKHHSIDIVHAYDYPWAQGFVAAYLAKRYKKKYVQTIFGEVVPHKDELVYHDEVGEGFRGLSRYVLSQSHLLLSVSKHCAREVKYVGLLPGQVKVTYFGVDTKRFDLDVDAQSLRSQYKLEGKRVILFLGQVRLRKGPQVLLEAAPAIIQREPNTVFLIVGPDYGITASLQARAKGLGISSQVLFLGPQPDEMLPAFFAACDIFVFPSCTPIECLGLSMIQAMACGKPVVGSNIDGIPEVIVDGSTGFLVAPNNPAELAEKVNLILEDSLLNARMGAAGRERAVEYFDRDRLAQQLVDLYRTFLPPASPSSDDGKGQ
jgi:glycosyltransferase involved in cell wall biosynthesis